MPDNIKRRFSVGRLDTSAPFKEASGYQQACQIGAQLKRDNPKARVVAMVEFCCDDGWDEERMDIIGQNGPTGDHYER